MSPVHSRTRIKICGMTRVDDVRTAVQIGVDAIGMILHADSPRVIDVSRARAIRAEVPPFVSLVGVFVDCPAERINQMAQEIGLDLIQLHGDESNALAETLQTPFIKAIRAREINQVENSINQYPDARALLLDPYVKGIHGGTGRQLDASLWPSSSPHPLILAGGLSPENVADSIRSLKPFAVDLNSGLETQPGVKDSQRMADAVSAVTAEWSRAL